MQSIGSELEDEVSDSGFHHGIMIVGGIPARLEAISSLETIETTYFYIADSSADRTLFDHFKRNCTIYW